MPDSSVQSTPDPAVEPAEQAIAVHRTTRTGIAPGSSQAVNRELYGNAEGPRSTRMNEIFKTLLSIAILVIGIAVVVLLFLMKSNPPKQDPLELVPMVDVRAVTSYTDDLDKVISGTVVPYREIRVAAEVNGNVIKKYPAFEAGNFVNKGDTLLEIDPADYQLQLQTGLAEVEQSRRMLEETAQEIEGAKRNIRIAEDEYKLAQAEFDRNSRIRTALSSTEFDQSKRTLLAVESTLISRRNTLDMLNSRLKRMDATLTLSKAQLERTKLNLSKTTVVAPDKGVIVREMVQEGDYVRAGDQLVMFEDTSHSEVICNLTTTDLKWIRDNAPVDAESIEQAALTGEYSVYHIPKTKVSVFEVSEPEIRWDGVLERFDGIGRDESTRTIPCRIIVDQPIVNTEFGPRALVRGMYVKCKIKVPTSVDKAQRKFVWIDAVALRPGQVVWVVNDHQLRKVNVEVVDYTEIDDNENGEKLKVAVVAVSDSSIKEGDMVVTTPLAQPSDGAEVILLSEQESKANKTTAPAE